jgi:hypothetical protein
MFWANSFSLFLGESFYTWLEGKHVCVNVYGAGSEDPGFCAPNGKIQAEHMERVR